MIEIPAGPFYANVDLDESLTSEGTADELRALPVFLIDRTEDTREAFEIYSGLELLTGDGAGVATVDRPSARGLPAVGINYAIASAYCEYLGKTLPSVDQWQKAFRGGLEVGGRENPDPVRPTPWHHETVALPANLMSDLPATAASFPDDTSPYGVRHMAGNVSEWSSSTATRPGFFGLRLVLGANWGTPPELSHHEISWRNVRHDRYLDFVLGLRCVAAAGDAR
jgi:formylglycine-generating enzyme required for sulfatase activity